MKGGGNVLEEDKKEIHKTFSIFLDCVNNALKNNFYCDSRKYLIEIKKIVSNWHEQFKKNGTLLSIKLRELQYLDEKIFEFVDTYLLIEPRNCNYSEILEHYLITLKRYWSFEIKKG